MKRVWALTASVLTIGTGTHIHLENKNNKKKTLEERVKKASELIKRHMTVNGIPGLVIGVTVDGEKLWSQGFGYSNLETGARCSEDTVMRIASISKPITATIAARLVQEGKLDINKPIQEYLPDFPRKTFDGKPVEITTKQLLCHTGGIRHYEKKNEKKEIEDVAKEKEPAEFLSNKNYPSVTESLKMFQDDELISEPGASFNYTTHGLTLVSAVLEKAGGKDFPKLIRQLCFQLELRNTHLDVNKKIIPYRASYYVRHEGVLENCQEVDNSYKWAGGGLLSNVEDLLRLANAYLRSYQGLDDSFLKKEVLEQFWKGEISTGGEGTTRAGLGWMRVDGLKGLDQASPTFWYHTGAAVGASSVLLIRPTAQKTSSVNGSGVCIALLSNLQYTSLYSLAADIEAIFHNY